MRSKTASSKAGKTTPDSQLITVKLIRCGMLRTGHILFFVLGVPLVVAMGVHHVLDRWFCTLGRDARCLSRDEDIESWDGIEFEFDAR